MSQAMDEIKIGKILPMLMKRHGFTFKKLSEASGISSSTLKDWATGIEPKSPKAVRVVARILGVHSEYLIFGEEEKKTAANPINELSEEINAGIFEVVLRRIKK